MNHPLNDIEAVIDALLKGQSPQTDLDPSLVQKIKEAIGEVESVNMDSTFKAQLLERVHQKLNTPKPFWYSPWVKVSMAAAGLMVVLVMMPPLFQDQVSPSEKVTTKTSQPKAVTHNLKTQPSGMIDITDNPTLVQANTDSKRGDSALDKVTQFFGKSESASTAPRAKTVSGGMIDITDNPALVQSRRPQPALNNHFMEAEMADESMWYEPYPLPTPYPDPYIPPTPENREKYDSLTENPPKNVVEHPISTFSIDVDTGSYANVRRHLRSGQTPPVDAVRVEEMINYFSYDYPVPEDKSTPFSLTTEIGPNPWNENTKLLHIGIKGYEKAELEKVPANLVFLVDVSGSMADQNKLPLLKQSLKLLSKTLNPEDRISIVTYAGGVSVVLDGSEGNDLATIESALVKLRSGGSTAGKAGIDLAYEKAQKHFIEEGINRILLATDGDFNVGVSNTDELKKIIEKKREKGISLTTLGFGMGNYNDHLMEQLANTGNGNYAYIDNLLEAQKVLVTEGQSTLETIAKDVKIQIEFNPSVVEEYRLIGYENRSLKREDFDNDKIDAGEIGAGHTVTAIYELALVGEGGARVPNLRYQNKEEPPNTQTPVLPNELGFLKIRYKAPAGLISKLIEVPMERSQIISSLDNTTDNYRFSAAVAAFGQTLRESAYVDNFGYSDILELARGSRGKDPYGYRSEFLQLVPLADTLK